MAFRVATWFPHDTVPESREYAKDSLLTATKTKVKTQGRRGQYAWVQESSMDGWALVKYVQFTAATAQGAPVAYGITGKAKVVVAASAANSGRYAGFPLQAQSASTWGWMQVRGANVYRLVTDKGVAAGNLLIKDQVTAGMLDSRVTGGSQDGFVCAVALQSDSGSFMAPGKAFIRCE